MIHHQMFYHYQEAPISSILQLNRTQSGIYYFSDGSYHEISRPQSIVNRQKLRDLLSNGVQYVFVTQTDMDELTQQVITQLRANSRSLSVGNLEANSSKQVKLLSDSLAQLYNQPENDELLQVLYQSSLNLTKLYQGHQKLIVKNYHEVTQHNTPYFQKHPLLTALMLIGYISQIKSFSEKEAENLFLISLLKDLGLSKISISSLSERNYTGVERKILQQHSELAMNLIQQRVPISQNYLEIMQHHHHFHDLVNNKKEANSQHLLGLETTLISVIDYIVDKTVSAPNQQQASLFDTLLSIKELMSEQYPQEYKSLILYLKKFFSIK